LTKDEHQFKQRSFHDSALLSGCVSSNSEREWTVTLVTESFVVL